MKIQLSDKFTYSKLIRFTLPSVVMMIFTSVYGVVDGIFVSNFTGKVPFAAINLVWPYLMLFSTVGFMIGTGGSALIAKSMGEGREKYARQLFSMLIYFSLAIGIILAVVSILLLPSAVKILGADADMAGHCMTYGIIILPALPFAIMQVEFQSFCITAERPDLGLKITVAAGMANIIGDALLVGVFRMGIAGAAIATMLSQLVGGIIPLVYFAFAKNSKLRLCRCCFDGRALLKSCTNGASELMTNLSMSLVNMLYNMQLMRYAGENGVAAYGVIMYVCFIFMAVFYGYSLGSAPVFSYHYGAGNSGELRSLLKKSAVILAVTAVSMTAAAVGLSKPIAMIFVSYDKELLALTHRAFLLYSSAYLIMSISMFGSSFFTALNNGAISGTISFLRALLFQAAAVLLLPLLLGIDGIWLALTAAEICAAAVTLIFFAKNKKRYNY